MRDCEPDLLYGAALTDLVTRYAPEGNDVMAGVSMDNEKLISRYGVSYMPIEHFGPTALQADLMRMKQSNNDVAALANVSVCFILN